MPTASIARLGPARVFTRESDAIAAIKGATARTPIKPGDVLVLCGRGPMGSGMEEIYQITSALKHLVVRPRSRRGHRRALLRRQHRRLHRPRRPRSAGRRPDRQAPRRRSDSDRRRSQQARRHGRFRRRRDRRRERSRPTKEPRFSPTRPPRDDLQPDADLPDDTRLWAALQAVGGGTWGGCVYDVEAIVAALKNVISSADFAYEDADGLTHDDAAAIGREICETHASIHGSIRMKRLFIV